MAEITLVPDSPFKVPHPALQLICHVVLTSTCILCSHSSYTWKNRTTTPASKCFSPIKQDDADKATGMYLTPKCFLTRAQ